MYVASMAFLVLCWFCFFNRSKMMHTPLHISLRNLFSLTVLNWTHLHCLLLFCLTLSNYTSFQTKKRERNANWKKFKTSSIQNEKKPTPGRICLYAHVWSYQRGNTQMQYNGEFTFVWLHSSFLPSFPATKSFARASAGWRGTSYARQNSIGVVDR